MEGAEDWMVKFKLAGADSPSGTEMFCKSKEPKNMRFTSPPAPRAAARPSTRVNGSAVFVPLFPAIAVGETYHVSAAVPSI